jgi:hypothetical protein
VPLYIAALSMHKSNTDFQTREPAIRNNKGVGSSTRGVGADNGEADT